MRTPEKKWNKIPDTQEINNKKKPAYTSAFFKNNYLLMLLWQINYLSVFSAFLPLALKGESRKINLHPLGIEVDQVDFSMFIESVKVELINNIYSRYSFK